MARKLIFGILLIFICFGAGYAQNFTLTSAGDTNAVSPATSALDAGGQITLRSAVQAATAWSAGGSHIITIPAGIGNTINLTIAGQMTIGSAANSSITINGPGKSLLTINQTQGNRIFSTTTAAFVLVITDLTMNGSTQPVGVTYSGGGGAIIAGGATGTSTTLTNVAINNFINQLGNGGAMSQSFSTGGAIHNFTVTNCDFTGNKTGGGGGALSYTGLGTFTITNSRFTNNSTTNGSGGAISTSGVAPGGTYSITQNTFTGNQTLANTLGIGGGAITNGNGQATISFNRFINNTAANTASGNTLYESGGGTVGQQVINADNNWWGTNTGPGVNDTSVVNGTPAGTINLSNWLQLKTTASPSSIVFQQTSAVAAGFLSNSANTAIPAANLTALVGLPVTWSGVGGSLSGQQTTIQAAGTATTNYLGTSIGSGSATAIVDSALASGSTNTAAITIGQAATTVVVNAGTLSTVSYLNSPYPVSFTLSVTSPGSASPTGPAGTVTLSDGSQTCTATLPATSCNITSTTPGVKSITAKYNGNTNFSASPTSAGVSHTVLATTAANVTVSGRVFDDTGKGIKARVFFTDSSGNTVYTITDTFGHYSLELEAGQTYVAAVRTRQYRFTPQVISVSDNVTSLDFVPEP